MLAKMCTFISAGLAFWLAGMTPAVAGEPIEREVFRGNVFFHQATCSRAIGPGTARCHAHIRTDSAGNPFMGKSATAAPNVTPAGYAPATLRTAYNIPSTAVGSSSTVVAIVDAYGYANAAADLAVYRAQYNLPPCTVANKCFTQVNGTGGTKLPAYNAGWAQEQALDLDMVSAMCPNCKILLINATNASFSALAQAVNTAVSMGAIVVSNSYGGGESGSSSYASAYNHTGVVITASAGDGGYAAGPLFPATAPGTVAVGGTSLIADSTQSRGWSEVVWETSTTEGTGSGCSTVYAQPSWQKVPGNNLCTTRIMADISAVADPATGVAVYGPTGSGTKSGWMVFGGTSVAAPLIGGIYGAIGGAKNAVAQQLIWVDAGAHTNDVTKGSNGTCSTLYFCTAGAGYDGPTGWGTPNGTGAF